MIAINRYNYTHISAAGTYNLPTTPKTLSPAGPTTLQPGPAVLHQLCINTLSTGSITVYDASGAVSGQPVIAAFAASSAIGTYEYNVYATNGITLVLAQAGDVTVSWSL